MYTGQMPLDDFKFQSREINMTIFMSNDWNVMVADIYHG